jgi:poly(beta-D-mannuronate) lyase
VVCDPEDDVIEVRLEDQRLLVTYDNGSGKIILDPAYVLDSPYDLEIEAAGWHIRVFYSATPKADITTSGSGWYFKAGSYIQSNPSRGDTPDALGQVVLYSLTVQHTP